MVQIVALGLIGGLGWYCYRAFKRQMAAVGEELNKSEAKKSKSSTGTSAIDELEEGPDGVYRTKDDLKKD